MQEGQEGRNGGKKGRRRHRGRPAVASAAAHQSALAYCRALACRYPLRADTPGLLAELRRFYRAGPEQKLRGNV